MRWEIYAGPRGIQRLIKTRRKNGILLPFCVSLIHRSRYALVSEYSEPAKDESGRPMPVAKTPSGAVKWTKYLKYGDMVRIEGAIFKIISGDEFLSAYDESNEVSSERVDIEQTPDDDGSFGDEEEDDESNVEKSLKGT
jgi:hypothetical protein